MKREPVNSLNLEMWSELTSALQHVESNSGIRVLVITTGLRKDVFSAGNDLTELYAPMTSAERYREFWEVSNRFLTLLYRSKLATVAAIRGACPAGGCIISLCCDYRIMTTAGVIGLNEVALGITVPKYWGQLMAKTVGQNKAEQLLTSGSLISANEAKSMGMVDELVDAADLQATAASVAQRLAKIPPVPRAVVKQDFRKAFAEEWYQYALREPEGAWQFLTQPSTVKMLGSTLERLSKGKAKL